jgi:hypothetical protein
LFARVAEPPLRAASGFHAQVHRWIYANVRARWDAVVRRPSKLAPMFSGCARARARAPVEHTARCAAAGLHRMGTCAAGAVGSYSYPLLFFSYALL